MQKKFLKNIIFLIFLNLLIKPFWILGIDVAVQNKLGAEDYGWYYAVFNFTFLLNIFLDFGITNFNNKNIAQNNHLLRKHLSNIVILKTLLGVIYFVISMVGALIIGYSSRQMGLLAVLGFNQFLISFVMYFRSNLSGLHLFKIDSVISILDRLIMIAACSIFLWVDIGINFDLKWFVFSQTLAYFLTALIAAIVVFHKAKSRFLKVNWNLPFAIMIIKKSLPFAILVLLMSFYNRIDTVMIERLLPDYPNHEGARQSGIYASAYRLLDATNMIAFLFGAMLLPLFSRMLKLKENVEELAKLAFTMLFVPAVVISFSCFYYSYDLMSLMYRDHVAESTAVFKLLMFCFVPISTTYIFGTLLTANGNLKHLNIMAACGMCVNILLNLILIPRLKSEGSAFASLTTQTLTAIVQVILAKKILAFNINYKLIFRMFIFSLGVLILGYFCKRLEIHWMKSFVILATISFVFAFVIKLINIRSFLNILKHG